MSYVVLARKWRPMSFRDLIGQEHVSRTLSNAIEQNRVAHAFLFTGARGVGKTTSARIVAKALNCLKPSTEASRSIEPCLQCAACEEIAAGRDIDVREIDGASYTGVEEIRKLQESLPYQPARDRYKIIIIDEVHMLSQNAWNALLKTLEEPPPHVKFLFATTEVHKVPITILSRVQRFDFKLISSRMIAERVSTVLKGENIQADDRAIALVARQAAGSMRDALSILDQGIAYSGDSLSGEELARVLGVASYPVLHAIGQAVVQGDPAAALTAVDALARESCDLTLVARDLVALLRDLVVAKLCPDSDELLDLAEDERQAVRTLSEQADASDLLRLQQGFSKSFDEVVKASDPRSALEMVLVKLALRPALLPLDSLLAQLQAMEARVSGHGGAPPETSGPPSGGGLSEPRGPNRPPADRSRPSAGQATTAPGRAAAPQRVNAARQAQQRPVAEPSPPQAPPTAPEVKRPTKTPTSSATEHKPPADSTQTAPSPRAVQSEAQLPQPDSGKPATTDASRSDSAPTSNRSVPSADAAQPADRQQLWEQILSHLNPARPDVLAVLQHAVPLRLAAKQIELAYEPGSALELSMRSDETIALLQQAALACTGQSPAIKFAEARPGQETLATRQKREKIARQEQAIADAHQHPSVKTAVDVLGARVKRVDLES